MLGIKGIIHSRLNIPYDEPFENNVFIRLDHIRTLPQMNGPKAPFKDHIRKIERALVTDCCISKKIKYWDKGNTLKEIKELQEALEALSSADVSFKKEYRLILQEVKIISAFLKSPELNRW